MSKPEPTATTDNLYSLCIALSDPRASLEGLAPLCELLWRDPEDRGWLIPALLRKATIPVAHPDPATTAFLARMIIAHFGMSESSTWNVDALAEVLPALVEMLPDEAWAEPSITIWPALLEAVRDDYGLTASMVSDEERSSLSDDVRALGRFFADAIGRPWSPELERQLAQWHERPEYDWLVAVRRSAMIDQAVIQPPVSGSQMDDPTFLTDLAEMPPFNRNRVLVVRERQSGETSYAEPVIEEEEGRIVWRFRIPVAESVELDMLLQGSTVGAINVERSEEGHLRITHSGGLFRSLTRPHAETIIRVSRAAAGETVPEEAVRLSDRVSAALQPARDGFALELIWRR